MAQAVLDDLSADYEPMELTKKRPTPPPEAGRNWGITARRRKNPKSVPRRGEMFHQRTPTPWTACCTPWEAGHLPPASTAL